MRLSAWLAAFPKSLFRVLPGRSTRKPRRRPIGSRFEILEDRTLLAIDVNLSVSLNAGTEAGTTAITVTATAASNVDANQTVDLAVTGTGITAGDFTLSNTQITIANGTNSGFVTFTVVNDVIVEGNETARVTMSNPTNNGTGIQLGTDKFQDIVITDNDQATITIDSISKTENGTFLFTISSDLASSKALTGTINTANGTATAGAAADYTAIVAGTFTILGDGTMKTTTVTVTVADDQIVEDDETFNVNLSVPQFGGATDAARVVLGGASSGTGTITNNDLATITIGSISIAENGVYQFTITSDKASAKALTGLVNTSNGTATAGAGADYTAVVNTPFTILGDGATKTTTVTVTVNNDAVVEDDETFNITLSAAKYNATTDATRAATSSTATGTITNNDLATITIDSISKVESGVYLFTITSDNASARALTGLINTSNGTATAGTDYTAIVNGAFTILGDSATKTTTVTVTVNDDAIVEDDETFNVALSAAQYNGATDATRAGTVSTGVGTITNNDKATLTIDTISKAENGVFTLTVTSDKASSQPLTVTVNTSDVTTTTGVDYTAIAGGTATIPGDGTTKTVSITVTVADDAIVEADETFNVTITAPKFNTVTDASRVILGAPSVGVATITDNDAATVSISKILDGAEMPVPINGKFRISQTSASSVATTVTYTVTGTASSGGDFTALSGTATIAAGALSTDIDVAVVNDSVVEAIKSVIVTLNNITASDPQVTLNATPANKTATLFITDDDQPNTVTVSKITDGLDAKTPTAGKFRVSMLATGVTPTVVTYTVGGTATSGLDFTALSKTVTIPAGQTSADIDVTVLNDSSLELTETVVVTLTGLTADANISLDPVASKLTATLNIIDGDTANVSIAKLTDGAEAANPVSVTFRVSMTGASFTDSIVTYTVGGTSTSGSDFTALSGTVTIMAGKVIADITVPVINDSTVEATETVSITLTTVTGLNGILLDPVAAGRTATADITDNDTAVVSITKITDGVEANVPTNAKFRVTQSSPSSTDTVVKYGVGGTAISGSDFTALSGSVTILKGQTTADIDVAILNDANLESVETVVLTLASATGDADVKLSTDSALLTSVANITSSVAPTAKAVEVKTKMGTPAAGSLNATDPDPTAGPLTFKIVTPPKSGSVNLKADGSFTYTTTSPTFAGNDSFTYTAGNSVLTSAEATVTVKVNGAPVVTPTQLTVNGSAQGGGGGAGKLPGTDINQDNLLFSIVVQPAQGTVAITDPATGAFTYTPNAGATGTDEFTFKANDGALDSNVATASIKINARPVGAPHDKVTVVEGQQVKGQLAGTDPDGPGSQLTFAVGTDLPAAAGTLKIDASGVFTLTAKKGFVGPTSFTFTVSDANKSASEPVLVGVQVAPENQPPVTVAGSLPVQAGVEASGKLPGTDPDANTTLKFTALTQPTHGMFTLKDDGTFTYTPVAGAFTTDKFDFKANDGKVDGNSSTFTFTINQTPAAKDLGFDVDAFGTLGQVLLADDANALDPKTFKVGTEPAHGKLTITDPATGAFSYESNGTVGEDTFTYTVFDGQTPSLPATVKVNVKAVDPSVDLSGRPGVVFVNPGKKNLPKPLDATAKLGHAVSDLNLTSATIVAAFTSGAAKGDAFKVLDISGLKISGSNIKDGKTTVASIKLKSVNGKDANGKKITFKELTVTFKAGTKILVDKVLAAISASNTKKISQERAVTFTVQGLRGDKSEFTVSNALQAVSQ